MNRPSSVLPKGRKYNVTLLPHREDQGGSPMRVCTSSLAGRTEEGLHDFR